MVNVTMCVRHAGEPPWSELLPLFTEIWFTECELDTAMERMLQRQVVDGRDPKSPCAASPLMTGPSRSS